MSCAVIIGEHGDPHVASVIAAMRTVPLVLDARSLRSRPYVLDDRGLTVTVQGASVTIGGALAARGWVRRIVPDSWLRSVRADSREAAEASAWMTLLAAILQLPNVAWLTPIGAITRAENKLTQAAAANQVGVRTPRTVVTNDATAIRDAFTGDVVVKPLGAGHFVEAGVPTVVHATALPVEALRTGDLAVAPFLVQRRLDARRHWRVVTVAGEVWSAALNAEGLSLDWRRDAPAHSSFRNTPAPSGVEAGAIATAAALRLGYSSQDWIETEVGVYLVDVNPSGQWLFLPEPIRSAVSTAIGRWIDGDH